jgi:iron-sulfur cluster repair protein YtfE (RIC family)
MPNPHVQNSVQFIDVPVHLLDGTKQEIVDYLMASHVAYRDVKIPKIEQQFLGLMKLYPNTPALGAVFNLFQKFQLEMQWHMKHEEQVLYPQAISGIKEENTHVISHEDQEPFLTEIIQLLESGRYVKNPFGRMLIDGLKRFDEDLRLHAWIEENLLML